MLQGHFLNAHCSRSIFAICSWSSGHSNMLLEHICYILLEHFAFKHAPGAYLTQNITPDYQCSRSMLQEYNLGPKSHSSEKTRPCWCKKLLEMSKSEHFTLWNFTLPNTHSRRVILFHLKRVKIIECHSLLVHSQLLRHISGLLVSRTVCFRMVIYLYIYYFSKQCFEMAHKTCTSFALKCRIPLKSNHCRQF